MTPLEVEQLTNMIGRKGQELATINSEYRKLFNKYCLELIPNGIDIKYNREKALVLQAEIRLLESIVLWTKEPIAKIDKNKVVEKKDNSTHGGNQN